jgi:hypothetical protein
MNMAILNTLHPPEHEEGGSSGATLNKQPGIPAGTPGRIIA